LVGLVPKNFWDGGLAKKVRNYFWARKVFGGFGINWVPLWGGLQQEKRRERGPLEFLESGLEIFSIRGDGSPGGKEIVSSFFRMDIGSKLTGGETSGLKVGASGSRGNRGSNNLLVFGVCCGHYTGGFFWGPPCFLRSVKKRGV